MNLEHSVPSTPDEYKATLLYYLKYNQSLTLDQLCKAIEKEPIFVCEILDLIPPDLNTAIFPLVERDYEMLLGRGRSDSCLAGEAG